MFRSEMYVDVSRDIASHVLGVEKDQSRLESHLHIEICRYENVEVVEVGRAANNIKGHIGDVGPVERTKYLYNI